MASASKDSAKSAQLIYDPLGCRWLFRDRGRLRLLAEPDGLVLASFLPLRTLSDRFGELPSGSAEVVAVEDDCAIVGVTDPLEGPNASLQRIEPASVSLGTAEWRLGAFGDGWLACSAELCVSFVGRVGLRLFLPRATGLAEKTLTVTVPEGESVQCTLSRGKVTEHWIEIPAAQKDGRLRLEFDYPEPVAANGDMRDLGAVVAGLNIDGMGWTR